MDHDVIVIGVGYLGLTVALKLSKVNKKVLVLEAHDCVGGRVYTDFTSTKTSM